MVVRVINKKTDSSRDFHNVQRVEYCGGNKFWIDTCDSSYGYSFSEFKFIVIKEVQYI